VFAVTLCSTGFTRRWGSACIPRTVLSCAIKSAGRFACLLPYERVSPSAGSVLSSTPPAASRSGPGYSWRPFARPQRLPPLDGLHSGVEASGLLLRTLPDRLPRPFGTSALLPCSRLRQLTAASMPQARCASAIRFGWPHRPSPLPLRTFVSLRIKAFNGTRCLPGPPDESARFPFAPRNPSFSSVGYGSPFQVRYVFGRKVWR
jgi:hypothetical protein